MTQKTFIFVGRSGSGKGTQVEFLKKYLAEKDTSRGIKSLVMGELYRNFFKEEGYVQDIARDVSMNQGKFQPDFLTNGLFIYNAMHVVDGVSHLFVDGYPRTIDQFEILKELFIYTKITSPVIVEIAVSRESVKNRMLARGRGDDSSSAIDSRLDEYERATVPMIEAMKKDPSVTYIEIDGEPSPDEIHKDIIMKLNLA